MHHLFIKNEIKLIWEHSLKLDGRRRGGILFQKIIGHILASWNIFRNPLLVTHTLTSHLSLVSCILGHLLWNILLHYFSYLSFKTLGNPLEDFNIFLTHPDLHLLSLLRDPLFSSMHPPTNKFLWLHPYQVPFEQHIAIVSNNKHNYKIFKGDVTLKSSEAGPPNFKPFRRIQLCSCHWLSLSLLLWSTPVYYFYGLTQSTANKRENKAR